MRRITPWLLIFAVAAIVYLFSSKGWLRSIDTIYYDLLVSHSTLAATDDVVIVAVDEASLAEQGAWPWDRVLHAKLVEKLRYSKAVAFDIIFSEPQSPLYAPADESALGSSSDLQFARAIATQKKVILPVFLSPNTGGFFPQEILPLPILAEAASSLGHIQLSFDADGIARKVYLYQGVGDAYWPHVSLVLQEMLDGDQRVNEIGNPIEQSVDAAPNPERSLVDPSKIVRQGKSHFRFLGRPGTVPIISYADVIDGKVPVDAWRNKIVFVGATAEGLGDYVPTPLGFMAGVEFNVNIFESLRQQGLVRVIEGRQRDFLTVTLFLLSALLLVRLPPRSFLLSTLALAFIALALAGMSFIWLNTWWPVGSYLLGVGIFYPLWSWRRIEIALRFLLDELSSLDQASSILPKTGGIASIEKQLEGLKKISMIDDFSVQPLAKAVRVEEPGEWHVSPSGAMSATVENGGTEYLLNVHSKVSAEKIGRALQSVLVEEKGAHAIESDSIELVERTIEKIQSTQQAVDSVRERMNRSMARLQDAVIITDASGRIVFRNMAAERLFDGIAVDQSVVELEAFIGGHVWRGILLGLLSNEESIYQELDVVNESIVLCQASWFGTEDDAPSSSDQSNYLLFVFTDVTNLRAAEQSKNEALAFLSHDMRSPIVSQLAMIESIRQSSTQEAEQLELLESLEQFGRKSLKYAEDFLQLSRAENLDKRAFYLVDVHGVIDGAVSQQQGYALQKHVKLKVVRVDDDVWTSGDAGLLERAVSNLVSNAIQHSLGGRTVEVHLNLDSQVEISVVDTGAGIADEVMPRLFEPYFRSRNKRVDDRNRYGVQSYGLGLSFVRTVVNRHGGQLHVESIVGEGTEFKISLPIAQPE